MSVSGFSFSLNRIARVTDKEYELFLFAEKKIAIIAKKYGFFMDLNSANNGDYIYLTIHCSKPTDIILYKKEILDLPDIKEDEEFYAKTEDFIIEASTIFPTMKRLSFSSPGKRLFVK